MNIQRRSGPHFRLTEKGMVLIGTQLANQAPQFPPTEHLVDDDLATEVVLGPKGRLYSYSVVHPGKDKLPYALAMVDFVNVRAFGRLVFDGTPPPVDSEVRVVPFTLPDGDADYAFQGVQA